MIFLKRNSKELDEFVIKDKKEAGIRRRKPTYSKASIGT